MTHQCQHGMIMGMCPRCDDEVAALLRRVDEGELLGPEDLNLNPYQRADFKLLLLVRQAKAASVDAAS